MHRYDRIIGLYYDTIGSVGLGMFWPCLPCLPCLCLFCFGSLLVRFWFRTFASNSARSELCLKSCRWAWSVQWRISRDDLQGDAPGTSLPLRSIKCPIQNNCAEQVAQSIKNNPLFSFLANDEMNSTNCPTRYIAIPQTPCFWIGVFCAFMKRSEMLDRSNAKLLHDRIEHPPMRHKKHSPMYSVEVSCTSASVTQSHHKAQWSPCTALWYGCWISACLLPLQKYD